VKYKKWNIRNILRSSISRWFWKTVSFKSIAAGHVEHVFDLTRK